jgi:hypothetical protein
LWKSRTHHQFPLSHLFDGEAATTWADSSPRKVSEHKGVWRSRFGLNINTELPSRIDELWIMNGYNKNQELFKRNDRFVEMEIWINGTKVKTAHLSDRMGWHKISVPPNNFRNIGLLFTGIRKGNGPGNDVCISELALRYKGKTIDMKMPESVFFEDGNRSGDAELDCALIAARGGKVITHGLRYGFLYEPEEWSPDKRHVCGLWRTNEKSPLGREKMLLWIADVNKQKIVQRAFLSDKNSAYSKKFQWLNHKTLEVQWIEYSDVGKDWKETIKFRQQYKTQ